MAFINRIDEQLLFFLVPVVYNQHILPRFGGETENPSAQYKVLSCETGCLANLNTLPLDINLL